MPQTITIVGGCGHVGLPLGIALANSGLNEVRGLTGSLLETPSDALAEQLFAMLVPALIASYAGQGAGAGNIDSGNATAIGNQSDFLATRVSYKLNLTGPSMTIQTACSTSLVAVHFACQSILAGR